jgi:hypothetical protein
MRKKILDGVCLNKIAALAAIPAAKISVAKTAA